MDRLDFGQDAGFDAASGPVDTFAAVSPDRASAPIDYADIPGNRTTTAVVSVGGSVTNLIEVAGDEDWFQVALLQVPLMCLI